MKRNTNMDNDKEVMLGNDCSGKCCVNCNHFDGRTHFCRLNPPTPMVFYVYENREKKQNVSSKFPTVIFPEKDFCSYFSHKNLLTENK